MTLSEKVAQLLELQSDAHIREEALKVLDLVKGQTRPEDFLEFADIAYIVAAFVRELTRTSSSDAPRIIKRVITDTVVARDGVG